MGFFDWLRDLFFETSKEDGAPSDKPDPKITVPGSTPSSAVPQSTQKKQVIVAQRPLPPVPMQHPPKPKPKAASLNLEMAQFAPLTGDELKKQARGLGSRFGSPWFGRRDVIPPASDERTRIIDRGMVGAGLLTPEELVELHKIGDEMARLKPDLAQAATQAQQAVAQDKEARAALKKKKKEEAAERKRLHAEGVAKRKATDIIFLGRGVSKGLADRRANVEKLQAAKLPVLAQPSAIAQALELPIKRLRWLCFHSEAATRTHYIRFTVPKKNGGTRELAAPHRDLARCQQWILKNILEKVPTHSAAHGFIPKRSTLTNAKAHVGQAAVLNLDLKDFFPTIRFHRVRGIFNKMGYSPAAATILGLLCTESPRRVVQYAGKTYHVATGPRGLPQGACTSPALSNLAARKLDARLEGISTKLGWTYTRYADDMTFSGNPEAAKKSGYLLARIRHIAENERFDVNEEKTRIQRVDTAQLVTGIVVNTRPGVPRKLARRLRAILHRAKKEGLAAQNRQNRPHFEAWLQGMISYVAMVNPAQAQPLQTAFDALK